MFFDSITKKRPIIKTHCCKKIQKCVFFWCNVCDFLNLSIFVREYRTRRPGTSHSQERYVTKPQTSHNNMQKTRPRYLNLERFYWGSVFARQKKTLCIKSKRYHFAIFWYTECCFFTCKNWSSIKYFQIKILRSSVLHIVVWSLRFCYISFF